MLPPLKAALLNPFEILNHLLHPRKTLLKRLLRIRQRDALILLVDPVGHKLRCIGEALDLVDQVFHVGVQAGGQVFIWIFRFRLSMCLAFRDDVVDVAEALEEGVEGEVVEGDGGRHGEVWLVARLRCGLVYV